LLDLLVAGAIGTILACIAVPAYQSAVQKARVAAAASDIMRIGAAINRYSVVNNSLPPDLAAVGMDGMRDPWGQPYAYLSFAGLKGKGKMRKDKNLVPINTQYDLYSVGADGLSQPPLTAAVSRDDVIMANDGNYVGLASAY
jgi:general secretion pathway protein G